MFFRQLLNDETACASYLLGCKSHAEFAVVDPHADLVDTYVALAEAQGARISAVLETHVQADHLSGMAALVERTGATAYMPAGAEVEFEHTPLADGDVVRVGNTEIDNVALRCRSHNDLAAEQDFGRVHIRHKRAGRTSPTEPNRAGAAP